MTPLQTRLTALLPGGGKLALAAQAAVAAVGLPAPAWLRWLDDPRDALPRLTALRPAPLVPIAVTDTEVLALDACAEAVERACLPVIASTDGRWWRPVAASLDGLHEAPPGGELLDSLRFSRAARLAPTSFSLHAAKGRLCRDNPIDEAARMVGALRRPLHGARDLEEIREVQERALALESLASLDPMTLRLARAGLDPEEWRTVGGERAVAGKTGDALRALDGALFLGAAPADVFPGYERLLARTGWGWARALLELATEPPA